MATTLMASFNIDWKKQHIIFKTHILRTGNHTCISSGGYSGEDVLLKVLWDEIQEIQLHLKVY